MEVGNIYIAFSQKLLIPSGGKTRYHHLVILRLSITYNFTSG